MALGEEFGKAAPRHPGDEMWTELRSALRPAVSARDRHDEPEQDLWYVFICTDHFVSIAQCYTVNGAHDLPPLLAWVAYHQLC